MKRNEPERALVQDRRAFMKTGGVATAALLAQGALPRAAQALPEFPTNPRTADAMPTRNLGKTGYRVGIFSLGGQSALERGRQRGASRCRSSSAHSTSASTTSTRPSIYGGPDRWSERYIGQVMKRRRARGLPG